MSERTIKVPYLARVEGEGSLFLKIRDNTVEEAKLKIFEPPRFFEALLRGRDFREAPDVTSRICGICPVAYLMSACHAMEMACGVTVGGQLRALRRLLYCGEWIESHVLHVFMLHAPDFLGFPDAIEMAKVHRELVKNGLRLVGGFYKVPRTEQLSALEDELSWALDCCMQLMPILGRLEFPEFEQDYEYVCLRHPDEYPLNEGRLVSNLGMDAPVTDYDRVLAEYQVQHSTSLHTEVVGRGPAHLGPLARYNVNCDRLGPRAREAANAAGLGESCRNPFKSILVRMVEVVFAVEEALRIINAYEPPSEPAVEVEPRAGTGYGATEAPRGICYQRYTINSRGIIRDCKIVAPTSVNQAVIERDLFHFAEDRVDLSDDEMRQQCEQVIRNYDPCISCSCHFLKLTVDRG
jgi:coenzyme F420-reducing hydrogenase alpha subunit